MSTIPLSQVLNNDLNAFKTSTTSATDYAKRPQTNSFFGDTIIGGRVDSVSAQFLYNISSRVASQSTSGTGLVSHVDSQAALTTGTGIGEATLRSVQSVVHYPGHECHLTFDARFTSPISETKQRIGAFNGDGFWIGYIGTTFGVASRKADVDTFVPMSSFNGDDVSELDPTKLNLYRITYGTSGVPTTFEVALEGSNQWKTLHRLDIRNTSETNLVANSYLFVQASVEKTSATPNTPITLYTTTWSAGSTTSGGCVEAAHRFNTMKSGVKSIPADTPTNVITISNPTVWNGLDNHISSKLMYISVSTDGTQSVDFEFLRNATVGGTQVFTPVAADASPLEYDTAGTTVSGGSLSWGTSLAKVSHDNINTTDYELVLRPGETTTLTATSASSTNVSVYLRAKDLF